MLSTFLLRAIMTFFLGLGFAAGGMYCVNGSETGVIPSQYAYLGWAVYPLAFASAACVAWCILPGKQEQETKIRYGIFQAVVGLIFSVILFLFGLNVMFALIFPTAYGGPSTHIAIISLSLCIILILLSLDWFKRSLRGMRLWSKQRQEHALRQVKTS